MKGFKPVKIETHSNKDDILINNQQSYFLELGVKNVDEDDMKNQLKGGETDEG